MGICGTWHGCQQPDPKKCPTLWKATSREFSGELEQYTGTQTLGWAKAVRPGCSSKGTSLGNSFLWRGAVWIFDANADTFASQVLCRSLKWWLKPSILGHKNRLMHCKSFQAQAALTCLPFRIPSFRKGANKINMYSEKKLQMRMLQLWFQTKLI